MLRVGIVSPATTASTSFGCSDASTSVESSGASQMEFPVKRRDHYNDENEKVLLLQNELKKLVDDRNQMI